MGRLVDKYRPDRFEKIVGQDASKEILQKHVRAGGSDVFLLSGPFGCGKTSLATITAAALLCEARASGTFAEPCRECPCCAGVEQTLRSRFNTFPLLEFNDCGRDKTVGTIRRIAAQARIPPTMFGSRRVIVLDEVHVLDPPGFQALLEILDRPDPWLTVFLVTTEPDAIPDPIHSRCKPLAIELVPDALAHRYAAWICSEEEIPFENEALDLLVAHAAGHVRDLVKFLDLVGQTGAVDVARVQRLVKLGHTETLIAYLTAVLNGRDLAEQVAILGAWSTEPGLKAEALQRLLWFMYMNDVRRQHVLDRTLIQLSEGSRAELVTGFNTRARAEGRVARAFWEDLISFWTLATGTVNEGVLRERMMRFDARINPPNPPAAGLNEAPARIGRRSARRSRSIGVNVAKAIGPALVEQGRYLTRAQVRKIWDAGSFMARHHGCWFNARATFRHANLGLTDHKAAAELVSNFTHELRLGLHRWGPANSKSPAADEALHWICLHENEAGRGPVSTVIAHIPARHHRDVRAWFGGPFLLGKGHGGRPSAVRLKLSSIVAIERHDRRPVWLHAHLMRLLCRGLEPTLLARGSDGLRRPLIDLLSVRPCLRRPAGGLALRQTYSTSDSISRSAQALEKRRGFEFLSAFGAGAWHRLDDGWEVYEHADRHRWAREVKRRHAEDEVSSRIILGDRVIDECRENDALKFKYDPAHMLRSWEKW